MSSKKMGVSPKTLKNRKRRQKKKLKRKEFNQKGVRVVKTVYGKKIKQKGKEKEVVLSNGVKTGKNDFRVRSNNNRNASNEIYMQNLANEIAFDVSPPSSVFYAMPAALVSLCLQRGWMPGAENASVPYLAFGYLCYVVQSFALNATLPVVKLPKCLALYCHSLLSKSVATTGGKVNYKFNFVQDNTFPFSLTLGPNSNALFSLGVPGSTLTGMWNNAQAPTTFTLAAGQTAYQSLTQFLENPKYCFEGTMLELVSATAPNKMDKDISAFAVTYADPGGAYNFTGGFGKQCYLEAPIHSPLYCVNYYNPNNTLDINRYASFTNSFAGSGFLLAATATIIKEKWIGMKTPPTFKPIDFLEFVEVYALVLQKGLYAALNDPQTQTQLLAMPAIDVQAYLYANYQCPLTLQEFSVLLRDIMMNLLKDTQFAIQDVFPRSSAVSDSSLFTAYVAGTNTCALGGSTMMLIPRIIIENMRACTYAIVESGKNGRNPIIAMPILGQFSGQTLNTDDYAVTINVGSSTYTTSVFAINSSEVNISLIDGTTTGDAQVVFINDPGPNDLLTTKFNDWINGTSQMSTFISNLTTVSTDAGVSVLSNMNISSYWITSGSGVVNHDKHRKARREYWNARDIWNSRPEKEKLKGKEPVPDWEPSAYERRFGRKDRKFSHLDTSPYASAVVENIGCRYPLIAAIWEGGQQFFVKPSFNAVTEPTVQASNQISRIGAQQREFNNLIVSLDTSNTELTLAYYHDMLASMCVAARNAPTKGTVFEHQLEIISDSGQGSIFTDIASVFNNVAAPLLPVVSSIAMAALKKGPTPRGQKKFNYGKLKVVLSI